MFSQEISRQIDQINELYSDANPQELLHYLFSTYGNKLAFATSLGAEDQILTHFLAGISRDVNIFTLDTGRLFPETLDLLDNTNKRYDLNIKVYFPDATMVEDMVNKKGINLFYESIANRKECCHIRKILPMRRALKGAQAWISGLRAEQSVTRNDLQLAQWDDNFKLIKISPLRSWTEARVWDFIREQNIPYNALHDNGYPSIGCLPCTRAVEPGEDIRAGRWWWEQPEMKECGLHKKNDA